MTTIDKRGIVTLEELVISSLATADALVKLLIERGLIAEREFMSRLSAEKATYQRLFQGGKVTDA